LSEISGIGCDEVLHEIEHYLHGELEPTRSQHLAEHLAECAPCFERAEFQRKLKDIVRTKCRSQATPEHLVVRIHSAIRAERPPGHSEA
jgi:anti-sigma factor (TIGR02949 family)